MAFFQVPELNKGIYEVVLLLFNATFGDYDLGMFDVYESQPTKKFIGHFLLISFLFINVILLLNMVVAMMTDTYAEMNFVKKGIYNYQIMRLLPQYKINLTYGGIISWTLPLNVFSILTIPFYVCMKDRKALRRLTSAIMFLNYMVQLLICSVPFVCLNLLMLPFAYLKTILAKILLNKAGVVKFKEVLVYALFGVPLLLALQVTDLYDFVTWSLDARDFGRPRGASISEHQFLAFF